MREDGEFLTNIASERISGLTATRQFKGCRSAGWDLQHGSVRAKTPLEQGRGVVGAWARRGEVRKQTGADAAAGSVRRLPPAGECSDEEIGVAFGVLSRESAGLPRVL